MSNFKLNLPTDIPWKRICVSNDMIDPEICDARRPRRWNSSIAIFTYQPEADYQSYEDKTITYLKVVCSITGYQASPEEIGLHKGAYNSLWKENSEVFKSTLLDYYPCYGAILEVAVAPHEKDIPLQKYPYFADFEPKKRELYELVTQTGEVMSRTLEGLSVGKGSTTLSSHEILDVNHGMSADAEFKYGGTGGGFGFSSSGEWGTKDISQQEASNIRTTDHSQESRETESHTTQLSQLYHQLDSYHLGTNRAVFFILPRPHTVETEFTFVNGPRNIEGIQEFFFVVVRPKDVREICFEAYLETGHIARIPIMQYDEPLENMESLTLTVDSNLPVDPDTLDSNDDDNSQIFVAEGSKLYTPPPGWEIDLSKGNGGWSVASTDLDGRGVYYEDEDKTDIEKVQEWTVLEVDKSHLVINGRVSAAFIDKFDDNQPHPGHLSVTITIYLKKINPTQSIKGYEEHLYLTARDLCCCDRGPHRGPYVSWERAFETPTRKPGRFTGDQMSVKEANVLGKLVGREFIKSRNDIDHRYDPNTILLHQTQFFAMMLSKSIYRGPDDKNISRIDHLSPTIKNKIQEFSRTLTLSSLLKMPPQKQKDLFDLSDEELQTLRTSLTAIDQDFNDPKMKWLTTAQQRAYLASRDGRNPPFHKSDKPRK